MPAEAAREFSPPELTLCADSYSVSVPPPYYRSGTKKTPVILPKVQVAGYTQTRVHPWPNEVGVGWLCRCAGIVWEPFRKRAHTQLIRKHSDTVFSARWATVDWSLCKEWNKCPLKKKSPGREWMVEHSPKILAIQEKATMNGWMFFYLKENTAVLLSWSLRIIFKGCKTKEKSQISIGAFVSHEFTLLTMLKWAVNYPSLNSMVLKSFTEGFCSVCFGIVLKWMDSSFKFNLNSMVLKTCTEVFDVCFLIGILKFFFLCRTWRVSQQPTRAQLNPRESANAHQTSEGTEQDDWSMNSVEALHFLQRLHFLMASASWAHPVPWVASLVWMQAAASSATKIHRQVGNGSVYKQLFYVVPGQHPLCGCG